MSLLGTEYTESSKIFSDLDRFIKRYIILKIRERGREEYISGTIRKFSKIEYSIGHNRGNSIIITEKNFVEVYVPR